MLVDTHCHLPMMDGDPRASAGRAQRAGVAMMVCVGVDVPSSRLCVELAADTQCVRASVGIHPNDADAANEDALAEIAALANAAGVVAVGETGMDHYRRGAEPGVQEGAFRAHIRIAKDAGKALVIHDREAHDDILRILLDEGAPERTVFHCFSGGPDLVATCAEHGWFMSFAGNVTFRSAGDLRAAAAAAPLELVLVETDSPFLAPVPLRGRPNAPEHVRHTVALLAGLHGLDADEMAARTAANAARAFGW